MVAIQSEVKSEENPPTEQGARGFSCKIQKKKRCV